METTFIHFSDFACLLDRLEEFMIPLIVISIYESPIFVAKVPAVLPTILVIVMGERFVSHRITL